MGYIIIAVLLIAVFLIIMRVSDRETSRNLSFLTKIILLVVFLVIIWVIKLAMQH